MTANDDIPRHVEQLVNEGDFDVAHITRFAIDQVIVDGEVDGANRRAPLKMLTRIAFEGVRAPDPVFHDFQDALTDDRRYLDTVHKRYGYVPVIEGETKARARPASIVNERGIYSEDERRAVMDLMEFYTELVYQRINAPEGNIVSVRQVSGVLNSAGVNPSYHEWGGFLAHMRKDPRFNLLDDGRVILAGYFDGPVETPPELPSVGDFGPIITDALPYIFTGPDRVFKTGALLGTLKAMGTYVRQDQIEELHEYLRLHPDIEPLEDGRFRITSEVEQVLAEEPIQPERTLSLDMMIRETFGSGRNRKPRSKRRSGWKHLTDMSEPSASE